MTLFEYLAAGYVLMLSFAVLRAMSGIPHAMRSSRRYWIHATWLVIALVLCLVSFWAFWSYREVEWTIFKYMNVLAVAALHYSFNSLLVPPDPSIVTSWRDYFFDVRVRVFATGTVLMTAILIGNQSSLGIPLLHASQLGNYAMIAMFLVGLSSAKPRVHIGLVLAFLSLLAVFFSTLLVDPESVLRAVP